MNGDADIIQNHPTYWFHDGSLILDVGLRRFKVHRTLIARHSPFFSKNANLAKEFDLHHVVSPNEVRLEDVEALMQYLYHDAPLDNNSSFSRVLSILRISNPKQLDFPGLHLRSRGILDGMFSSTPAGFEHDHCLYDALVVCSEFHVLKARKAILYTLVTTTEFDIPDEHGPPPPENSTDVSLLLDVEPTTTDSTKAPSSLSKADARTCMDLMTHFINHFTPILFTPPAASHMACTDVFAGRWMALVIQPALEDDGVYKPLETLERIRGIDWKSEGLCHDCCVGKREEWENEKRSFWGLMDGWLGLL